MQLPLRILFLTMLVVVAVVTPARADFLGDTLKPFASVTEMYDSNVFRVRDRDQLKTLIGDERLGDFVTVASVGTGIRYQVSRQELNLLLQRDFIRYGHYSDQDVDRDVASGGLKLSFLDALQVRIDGSYAKTPEPRADYRSADVNRRREMAAGASVGYAMTSGLGFEASYRRLTVDYSLPLYRSNEHSIDRYAGTLSYRVSPEARVYATYQRDDTEYGESGPSAVNNSSSADSIRVGLDKVVSPRTSVSCAVGYLERRHKSSSARDYSGVVGKVSLAYGLTEKLGLLLEWERQLYEETYAGRIYSVNDSIGAGFAYQFSQKVKGTVFDRFSWKDFRDVAGSGLPPRSDFTQELNTGVEWAPVNRLTLNVGYQYSKRNSDDSSFDFTDHIVSAGVAYRF